MIQKIKRIIFSVFAGITAVCSVQSGIIAAAKASDEQIKNDVTRAVQEMESIMLGSYDHAKDLLSEECAQGYDYELSLESFYDQGLPFAGYDYQKFIAAYATIQQYCFNNNVDLKDGINSINFVHLDTTPVSLNEYIPEKMDKYIRNEDGTYYIEGTIYLTEPGDVYTYEENADGTYSRTGTEYHDLELVETSYLDVALSAVTPEEVYETFGLDRQDFIEEEETRFARLKEILGKSELSQLTFIKTDHEITADDTNILAQALELCETQAQKNMISIASSLLGRIPYEWGGKSDKAGFDDSWYIFDTTDRQKGLDCSGYIQWVLRTAGFENWADLTNTSDFLASDLLYPISAQDLRPGDLGLFYPDSTAKTNHIGMYLGNGHWIHCSSTAGTVTITGNSKFSIFRRLGVFDPRTFSNDSPIVVDIDKYIEEDTSTPESESTPAPAYAQMEATVYEEQKGLNVNAQQDEIMLMAKVVTYEAYGEGYNGWVAVAQVIKNRTQMPGKFADTIQGVLSQSGQFSTYKRALSMSDTDVDPNVVQVCQKVLAGELGVIDNDSVIGFKRAVSGDTNWNGWSKYVTIGNHDFYIAN